MGLQKVTYIGVTTKEEVNNAIEGFISASDKPILMEVFTKEEDEVLAMVTFVRANTITTAEGKLRQIVGNVVGDKGIEILKKVIKR